MAGAANEKAGPRRAWVGPLYIIMCRGGSEQSLLRTVERQHIARYDFLDLFDNKIA